MPSLSTKKRKNKITRSGSKLNDELSNLVTIENKLDKIYFINEQQVIEINKLYDEIWKIDEPIKNSESLLAKKSNFAEGEIELIEEAKG